MSSLLDEKRIDEHIKQMKINLDESSLKTLKLRLKYVSYLAKKAKDLEPKTFYKTPYTFLKQQNYLYMNTPSMDNIDSFICTKLIKK